MEGRGLKVEVGWAKQVPCCRKVTTKTHRFKRGLCIYAIFRWNAEYVLNACFYRMVVVVGMEQG